MADHYFDEFVKFSYRVEHRGDQDPSDDDLHDWDELLHRHYGQYIRDALATHGIPDTRRNRSILALLSQNSAGSGRTRVDNAAEYWANVMGARVIA